jgi:hypothetical protein
MSIGINSQTSPNKLFESGIIFQNKRQRKLLKFEMNVDFKVYHEVHYSKRLQNAVVFETICNT